VIKSLVLRQLEKLSRNCNQCGENLEDDEFICEFCGTERKTTEYERHLLRLRMNRTKEVERIRQIDKESVVWKENNRKFFEKIKAKIGQNNE
jgi:hypothetical protein